MSVLALFLGALIVESLVRGLVLAQLWAWFLVPNLGAPPIGVAQAIGIALIVSMLTAHISGKSPSSDNRSATNVILTATGTSILVALITLLMGAIFHGYM